MVVCTHHEGAMEDFKEQWQEFLKNPCTHSPQECEDLLALAFPHQVVEVFPQVLDWAERARGIPGGGDLANAYRGVVSRTCNRLCEEAFGGDRERRRAFLATLLTFADRMSLVFGRKRVRLTILLIKQSLKEL